MGANGGKKAPSKEAEGSERTAGTAGPASSESTKREGPAAGEEERAAASAGAARVVEAGWGRYLVAPRPAGLLGGTVPPVEATTLFTLLEEDDDVHMVAKLEPSRAQGLGAIAELNPACPPVAVVEMPEERVRQLAMNPQVIVEADQPLAYSAANPVVPALPAVDPALAVSFAEPSQLTVRVKGADDAAISGAHVWAIGSAAPSHAVTGDDGRAVLTLPADTPATIRALHIRPMGEYWPARLDRPLLPDGKKGKKEEAVVELRPLSESFEGFPQRPMTGWGQQVMRLNQIPPTYRGHGIKIAILDSGVSTDHPDLKDAVRAGYDFTTDSDRTWKTDATGHGTWCAGVIAAADNQVGVVGVASETELHACKIHPGGRVSDLLRALDYCIAHDIDIAQINLSCEAPSQLVMLKILDARAAGVTCVAPAGDNGTAVPFPASLPTVLAVGAIGHTGTYPPSSPHAAHTGGRPVPPGIYSPAFTPASGGTDLVGPGVAVITTSSGGTYTTVDGTAVAAALISGLAALLLAHHPQLRAQPYIRSAARVDHLLTLLRASCRPLPGLDPVLTGAGLPDAPTALGMPTTPLVQAVYANPEAMHPEMQSMGVPQPGVPG